MASTGTCSVCDREIVVRKDGNIRHHVNYGATQRYSIPWRERCEGAGKPPKETPDA